MAKPITVAAAVVAATAKVATRAAEHVAAPTPIPTQASPATPKANSPSPVRYASVRVASLLNFVVQFGPAALGPNGQPINPKSGKSAARFACYQAGATVQVCLTAGVTSADIRWDLAHNLITVSAPV